MKLILMLTPVPPLTSEMTAVPTLCPFASFNSTVTGLEAAKAAMLNRAAGSSERSVKVDMEIVYKKSPPPSASRQLLAPKNVIIVSTRATLFVHLLFDSAAGGGIQAERVSTRGRSIPAGGCGYRGAGRNQGYDVYR